MVEGFWFYVAFGLFVLTMLALDLGVFHRKAHTVSPKEAGIWVGVWVSLALLFAVGLYVGRGSEAALLFVTGYVVEQSLSVDNIFVILLIFSYFKIPERYQHRVLFWGIVGALVMRGAFIGAGSLLVSKFGWIMYLFGAFLVYTGVKMATRRDETFEADQSVIMRVARRVLRVTDEYDGQRFFTRKNGHLFATPLFLVLLLVEFTDVIFAVDSIPAIFAVTTDPFLVYTSNIFAILGLRSLYFVLAGIVTRFVYLKYGLAVILTFVGLKMIAEDFVHVSTGLSLLVIVSTVAASIALSLIYAPARDAAAFEAVEKADAVFDPVRTGNRKD
jgi:TerC family integral membrane protein